jgi:hypothetical protein
MSDKSKRIGRNFQEGSIPPKAPLCKEDKGIVPPKTPTTPPSRPSNGGSSGNQPKTGKSGEK